MMSSFAKRLALRLLRSLLAIVLVVGTSAASGADAARSLDWQSLPDLPDALGVAGPLVGVHNDALIVAGGANFPKPVWENGKVWHDKIYVLTKNDDGYAWNDGGTLPRPYRLRCLGLYAGTASFAWAETTARNPLPKSLRCAGTRKPKKITRHEFPPLPQPCAYGQAALVGNVIYLAGGQSAAGLDSAMKNFWSLDLSKKDEPAAFVWKELDPWPGESRAFNLTVSQHDGYSDCVYVMSGRRQQGDEVEFLKDVWQFTPKSGDWHRRADAPRSVMAGTGIGFGQSHIFVLGGADGSLFFKADELRDDHPGFPKEALAYHTITDTWTSAGPMPKNHVTTVPVMWDGRIIIASGEVRPRVRSAAVWSITPVSRERGFGTLNYVVLFGYLAAMVGIGVYFTNRNKNTDDYFRGGKSIPWWAAGCSIFATMLSSLTFTGIPSKAFAQDWVYAVGNMMIPVVAFVAVFVALPFYRRIDATSAYEYLEKRFSRNVRWFGSASFTLFHVFRMAVVMSLTGLALAVATPLTPAQSVLLMGVLSIIYCTLGGIEAVIWTDTIQTFVLLGGGRARPRDVDSGSGWRTERRDAGGHRRRQVSLDELSLGRDECAAGAVGGRDRGLRAECVVVHCRSGRGAALYDNGRPEARRAIDLDQRVFGHPRHVLVLWHRHRTVCILSLASRPTGCDDHN